jgi:DNA-binding protein YbaB
MSDERAQQPPEGNVSSIGEAAEGQVRVSLDSTGRVRDVTLAATVASMPLTDLSEALVAAFRQAHDEIHSRAARDAAQYGGLPSVEHLEAVAAAAEAVGERRFNEISTVLYDLNRRAGSEW